MLVRFGLSEVAGYHQEGDGNNGTANKALRGIVLTYMLHNRVINYNTGSLLSVLMNRLSIED